MRRSAPFAALTAAALVLAAPALAAPPALVAAAEGLADALGPPAEGRRSVALWVEARARPLSTPLAAALEAALAARGYAVVPLRGAADAEAAARAGGHDWLLRVQAGLVPGERSLALVGELVPAWDSFFLQRRPGARAVPPRLLRAQAPADPETLLLAREARPAGAPFATVRPLAELPGRVLALAVGEVPGLGVVVAAVTPERDLLLSPAGEVIAARRFDPAALRPVRAPAATAALAQLGGGPLAVQRAGAAAAEVLVVAGDRLEPVAAVPAAPLGAVDGAAWYGAFAPGTGALADALAPHADPEPRLRSPRLLAAIAVAPRAGPVAFALLGQDLRLELLGPDLSPAGPPLERVGAGLALADLDGDGAAEVITSDPVASPPDRVRVLSARPGAPTLLASGPLDGLLLAAAAGDLTGDGVDDAVVAQVDLSAEPPATRLLLVTADPRELP